MNFYELAQQVRQVRDELAEAVLASNVRQQMQQLDQAAEQGNQQAINQLVQLSNQYIDNPLSQAYLNKWKEKASGPTTVAQAAAAGMA